MTARSAISRFHRDLTLSVIVRMVLCGAAVAALVSPAIGIHIDATIALMVIGAVWMILSWRSVQGSRLAAASPPLIAAGRYEAAEEKITDSLKSFSCHAR